MSAPRRSTADAQPWKHSSEVTQTTPLILRRVCMCIHMNMYIAYMHIATVNEKGDEFERE